MDQANDKLLEKIIQKAEAVCARAEYCDFDIQQKIITWGASEEQVEHVLNYLHEHNFLNNERYAKAFCVGKNRQLKWGRTKIAYQLRMKRVGERDIEEGLAEIDVDEYREGLRKLAERKWSLIHEEDRYLKEGKLIGFLHSHGYEMHEIKNVIKQL